LHVIFFCDVQADYDEANRTFHVVPLAGIPPVKSETAFNSIIGQGYYTSRSVFRPSGTDTQIKYSPEIKADLPRRRELDWLPDAIVKRLAEVVVRRQLREITATFIRRPPAELVGPALPARGRPGGTSAASCEEATSRPARQ
jgi:hypothetical protein